MTAFPDTPLAPKAVATRALILDVATEVFIERGYAAAEEALGDRTPTSEAFEKRLGVMLDAVTRMRT